MTGDPQARSTHDRRVRRLAPLREANDTLVTGTITIMWTLALAVLVILTAVGVLPASQRGWLWTCAAGVAMGLFGLWYVPKLQRARARLAARHAEEADRADHDDSDRADGDPVADGACAEAGAGVGQEFDSGNDSRASGSKTVSSTDTPGRSTRS